MKTIKTAKNKYIVFALIINFIILCGSTSQLEREQEWAPLMDGKTMNGWETALFSEGEPFVEDGIYVLPQPPYGGLSTGLSLIKNSTIPAVNYIIYYEARRVDGNDIFGGLSFPYKNTYATLVIGGWGGSICGLSSIDGKDALDNETTTRVNFNEDQWYPVTLRVTTDSIRAVVGDVKVVDISTAGKRIHIRRGTIGSGLTFITYYTTGEIRNVRLKRLKQTIIE